jgi:branched-chain amino acid aminotransferase
MSLTISSQDRGFLLGDGVFDTMTVRNKMPQLLDAHVARLVRHAATIHIAVDATLIRDVILNCAASFAGPDSIIRTTLTRGVSTRGLWPKETSKPTLVCHATTLNPVVIGEKAAVMVSTIARNETSPISRIKSIGYLDHVLAAREAVLAGFDDALFLSTKGNLACTTIGNLFVLEGDVLFTPPLSDGVLDGIIRAVLLDHPPKGLRVVEQSLTLERALKSDAMLVTNSVRLARPVTRLNDRIFQPVAQHQTVLSHLQAYLSASHPIPQPSE